MYVAHPLDALHRPKKCMTFYPIFLLKWTISTDDSVNVTSRLVFSDFSMSQFLTVYVVLMFSQM